MYLWIKKLNRDEFNRIYACGDTNYGWKKLKNLTILKSSVSLKQEFKSFILNLNYYGVYNNIEYASRVARENGNGFIVESKNVING